MVPHRTPNSAPVEAAAMRLRHLHGHSGKSVLRHPKLRWRYLLSKGSTMVAPPSSKDGNAEDSKFPMILCHPSFIYEDGRQAQGSSQMPQGYKAAVLKSRLEKSAFPQPPKCKVLSVSVRFKYSRRDQKEKQRAVSRLPYSMTHFVISISMEVRTPAGLLL